MSGAEDEPQSCTVYCPRVGALQQSKSFVLCNQVNSLVLLLLVLLILPNLLMQGWSPQRAKSFGAAMLPAIYEVLPLLRD